MLSLVELIGIFIAVTGLVFLLRIDLFKKYCAFWAQGNRIYFGAGIRFFFALVFLISAHQCTYPWLIYLFGILFLIGGGIILYLGREKVVALIEKYINLSDSKVKLLSILTIALGCLILVGY